MDSALLSSRDGYPLEPKSGLNGVKPPVEFGERTRDWTPGLLMLFREQTVVGKSVKARRSIRRSGIVN